MNEFTAFVEKMTDPQQRSRMQELLDWVGATFPELSPKLGWNQPMFTHHGTFIIGFSVAKHHLAVAPEKAAIAHFSDAIRQAGYEHTDNLIRVGWNMSVDVALLERIIRFNMDDKASCKTFWRP